MTNYSTQTMAHNHDHVSPQCCQNKNCQQPSNNMVCTDCHGRWMLSVSVPAPRLHLPATALNKENTPSEGDMPLVMGWFVRRAGHWWLIARTPYHRADPPGPIPPRPQRWPPSAPSRRAPTVQQMSSAAARSNKTTVAAITKDPGRCADRSRLGRCRAVASAACRVAAATEVASS